MKPFLLENCRHTYPNSSGQASSEPYRMRQWLLAQASDLADLSITTAYRLSTEVSKYLEFCGMARRRNSSCRECRYVCRYVIQRETGERYHSFKPHVIAQTSCEKGKNDHGCRHITKKFRLEGELMAQAEEAPQPPPDSSRLAYYQKSMTPIKHGTNRSNHYHLPKRVTLPTTRCQSATSMRQNHTLRKLCSPKESFQKVISLMIEQRMDS